jgi:hypothetical protein
LKEAGSLYTVYRFLKGYISKFLALKAKTTSVTAVVVVVVVVGGSSTVIGSSSNSGISELYLGVVDGVVEYQGKGESLVSDLLSGVYPVDN